MILNSLEYEIALSRVHYWGLVIWIRPRHALSNGESRPIVKFAPFSHPPILTMNDDQIRNAQKVKDGTHLRPFQRLMLNLGFDYLRVFIPRRSKTTMSEKKLCEAGSWDQDLPGKIPRTDQLFDNSSIFNMPFIMFVGKKEDTESLREHIKSMDASNELSVSAMMKFLSQLL